MYIIYAMKDVYLKQQIILSTCIIEKEHQHPTFWPNYKVSETYRYHNPSFKIGTQYVCSNVVHNAMNGNQKNVVINQVCILILEKKPNFIELKSDALCKWNLII